LSAALLALTPPMCRNFCRVDDGLGRRSIDRLAS
jgi:hypothetical protein